MQEAMCAEPKPNRPHRGGNELNDQKNIRRNQNETREREREKKGTRKRKTKEKKPKI